ncbi:MAG: DUF424 family protein [Candidatus Altiarchaeota archaeon]
MKVHRTGGEVLVACCDAGILGTRLSDGTLQVHVSEGFYGGEIVSEEDFLKLLNESTTANLLGDKVVDTALKRGLVEKSGIIDVCGVKHAQLYTV